MKIGIVCYPSIGGSGIMATELGHQLALRGHEVHFITYECPIRLREGEGLHFHQVEINHYDLFKYPDYALTLAVKIANVAKAYSLDVVHVHYAIPHATSAYLARQMLDARIAIITTLHGTDITLVGQNPAFTEIVKFSIEQSDLVTAVSKSLRQDTIDSFAPNQEIEVIPNFFVPRKLDVTPTPNLIVHSSNFRPVKRVTDVVRIFAQVRKKIPAHLRLIGSGPCHQEVQRLVQTMDLVEHVTFIGSVPHLDPYIADAKLFLLPSAQESFGLAALEAMSYGVPVVASDVGGLPELVIHGETGYLAEVGDIEKMADLSIEMLNQQSFGKKAQERALIHFSHDKIVPQYEQLYRGAISSP